MRITLHIGLAKTGTSTIQGFLEERRDALLAQRVLFPASPGRSNHLALAALAMSQPINIRARAIERDGADFTAKLARDLATEIARSGAERLLLSSEHCSSRLHTIAELRRLKSFLEQFGAEIAILIYLRRQDDYLLSIYSTAIKAGSDRAFAVPTGRKIERRYDYRALLELWSEVFGRAALRPRLFQPSDWIGGELLPDFCAAAELDLPHPAAPARNEALSAETLELVRLLNARSGGVRDRNAVRAAVELTAGPKLSLGTAARRAFLRNFEESNRWIAQTFFARDTLFEEVPEGLYDYSPPTISPERFDALRRAIDSVATERLAEAQAVDDA